MSELALRAAVVEALEQRQMLSTVSLDFNGGGGGVGGSGFTAALASSKGKGLVPGNIAVTGGQLRLATTAGDFAGTRNTQDNALNVAANTSSGNFTVQARLIGPGFRANWQSGGIFVGTGEDNYVKLVAGYNGGQILQLGSEAGSNFTSAALSSLSFAGVSTLDLRLVGTSADKRLVAQYRVNSASDSAWVTVGSVVNAGVFSTGAKSGVVGTNFGTTPVTVAYDSFSVVTTATTPPPPPPPPTPTGSKMTVGANVNASRTAANQVETEIAVNPTNANNFAIVAVDQRNGSSQLMVSRSFDGGKTWANVSLGSGQDKLSGSTPRVDPHVTFDRFGNLYVVYMVAASKSELRIIVARSTNGGASFTTTNAVAGQGLTIDFPFIGTGPDATDTRRETVWVGYTDTRLRRVRMVAARSTGLGNLSAFTAPTTVSDAPGSYGSVSVNASGQVVVGWQTDTHGQGPGKVMTDIDADGLGTSKTWGTDRQAATTNVGGFDFIPAQPDRSIDANVGLAFDRSPNSSTRGRLYLVYSDEDGNETNDTDIVLRYSDNQGATWSSPLVVNDDNTTRSQFLPAMAVDQTNGKVAIVWHDARNSAGNNAVQIWGTVSLDHGRSVLPNVRISAGTSSQAGSNTSGADNMDFGDYTGVAFHNNRFIPVWADNSNSTGNNPDGSNSKMDLYTAVVTLAP